MNILHFVQPEAYYINHNPDDKYNDIKALCNKSIKYIKNINHSYTNGIDYFKRYKDVYSDNVIQCEKCKSAVDNLIFL